jgi:hypothetical protein
MMLRLSFIVLLTTCLSCQNNKQSIAISKIKSAAKLATTETELTKMVFATQDRKFLGIIRLNQAQFAARTKATVKAGVNLAKIKQQDVRVNGTIITLELPAVEVIDFSYPFKSYEIDYTITDNAFGNKISLQDHEEIFRRAEIQIRDLLPYYGIKEATESRTRQLLEQLLRNLGFTEIYISFKKGDFIEPIPLTDEELR